MAEWSDLSSHRQRQALPYPFHKSHAMSPNLHLIAPYSWAQNLPLGSIVIIAL